MFSCQNPKCLQRHKFFSSFRALALHTAKTPACSNFLARAKIAQNSTTARDQILNDVHSIAKNIQDQNEEYTYDNVGGSVIEDDNQTNIDKKQDIFNALFIPPEHKYTIMLLKILDDMNAPDYAFTKIMQWAKQAFQNGYNFEPTAGTSRKSNIQQLQNLCFQSKSLLPKVQTVNIPHGLASKIVIFDFIPQLMSLLQNKALMTPDNLAIDFYDPLLPFQSNDGCLNEAISGSVYREAYSKYVKDPNKDFFVPIIQWIDRTHITGNERFSLKPYMFSPAIFKEKCRRKIEFWGFHGYIPKRKDSQAETSLRKPGDNIRNYHAELHAVLASFQSAADHLKDVWLPIGPGHNPKMQVNIVPCILCIIQDMQEGDMLCGRYGPHTSGIQRQCRSCDVNYENLDNPNIECARLYALPMHNIAMKGSDTLRKRWSQHQLDNVFNHMPMACLTHGILGSTPVDTMHAFRKGIIESTTNFIIENLKDGQKAALDHMAIEFYKCHSQTCRKDYPMVNLSSGITGLTKISASERVGMLFVLVILANLDRGSAIFEAAFALQQNKTTVKDIIEVLEAMLAFDAWLNQDSFWLLRNTEKAIIEVQESIRTLLRLCKKCFPNHKWQFPKFHEMLHVIKDMVRFGASKNFSAQRPESLLIQAAKRPGRRAKKTSLDAAYDVNAAKRVMDSFFINKFYQHVTTDTFPSSTTEIVEQTNECSGASEIANSTGQGTFGTIHLNTPNDTITVKWRSKTKSEDMSLPMSLMKFVVKVFGNNVKICTEFHRDSLIFRCHPKFQSNLPRYDWLNIRFETGIYPCRLALVVVETMDKLQDSQFHLVVQSTTEKTSHTKSNGSVLFTEWKWSDEYYCVLPENIVGSCFVVTNKDNASHVLETLPYNKWASQFTNQ